ncbi:MAG TPA: peptidylprolyl isomerase [Kiritimatiellia bacterium]|nr:peptidylprolyl isomerase [Kiritimatiellia bacterium]HNR93895.1 peptidylprolyl isomerase [Kiritimatiellia bacterium]
MNRKYYVVLIMALSAGLLSVGCSKKEEAPAVEKSLAADANLFAPAAMPSTDPNAVAVTVNGTEIKQGEVDTEVGKLMMRAQGRVPPERMMQMRGQMVDDVTEALVVKMLLEKAIDEEKITATEEEIAEGRAKVAGMLEPGVTLEQQLEEVKMSEEDFRKSLVLDIRINKLLKAKAGEVEISDEKVKEFYDENSQRFEMPESVTASHILIMTDAQDDEDAKAAKKAKIEELRQQILGGADFAELAKEHSDCPSKARGGNLGTFGRGQMVPPFEEAAFSQELGKVGDVVETQFGYHLILVEKREPARTLPLEEVSERIREGLQMQSQQAAVKDYIEQLKTEADIVYPEGSGPVELPVLEAPAGE